MDKIVDLHSHVAITAPSARSFGRASYLWSCLGWLLVGVLLLPMGVVLYLGLTGLQTQVWQHLWNTRLLEMLTNTLVLMLAVGGGTLVLGVALAWMAAAYDFPGRSWMEWALLLPLAMPSYVLAFVFLVLWDYTGPLARGLRALGVTWLPPVRSGWGAAVVMSLTLYPYVYLLARAAFYEQGRTTFETARTLGASPWEAFWRVVLPMARPSLAAGVSLVLMEVLTEVGTVRFLNFPTLSDGIFRVWHGMMNRDAAVQMALLLLFLALMALVLERRSRRRSRYFQEMAGRRVPRTRLEGWRALLATGFTASVFALAFLFPTAQLVLWVMQAIRRTATPALWQLYGEYVRNTFFLAALTAMVIVLVALVLAFGRRWSPARITPWITQMATLGYAVPGAVIGLGVLLPLAWLDHTLNGLTQAWWGITLGLVFTGSLAGLVYGYTVRFLAVAYSSIDASLEKISPNLAAAARTLGATPLQVLREIHLPLIRVGLFTAALLVFVDVMKDLPITLLLRPFGYNTLALWVWQDVAESLWEQAALPALTLVLVGLLPVILLIRASRRREVQSQPQSPIAERRL